MTTKVISVSSLVIAFGTLLFIALIYDKIPLLVPSHYNLDGMADGWSSRSFLWYPAAFNVIITILLGVLTRYPHKYNYPFKVTEENKERVYAAASFFVALLQLVVCIIMSCIVIQMSLALEHIPIVFNLSILALPPIALICGLVLLFKARK